VLTFSFQTCIGTLITLIYRTRIYADFLYPFLSALVHLFYLRANFFLPNFYWNAHHADLSNANLRGFSLSVFIRAGTSVLSACYLFPSKLVLER
jgi:hypothetical protein